MSFREELQELFEQKGKQPRETTALESDICEFIQTCTSRQLGDLSLGPSLIPPQFLQQ